MPKILIDQPSRWPNRKVMAAIIAGAATGALTAAARLLWPDLPAELVEGQIDQIVTAVIMAAAAYWVREAA